MSKYTLPLWNSKLFLTVDLNAFTKTVVSAVNDGHAFEEVTRDWPPALIAAVRTLMTAPADARSSNRH